MNPEDEALEAAQPSWMNRKPSEDSYVRSPDYPFSPLLQKKPPILTTESVNLGLGGGSAGDEGATYEALYAANGVYAYAKSIIEITLTP